MKYLWFIVLALTSMLAGCNQITDRQETSEYVPGKRAVAVKGPDTICFERYSGLKKQDTASVRIIFSGSEVHGDYSNFPYQKDARIGKISGRRSGTLIKGIWQYHQEGMNDSIPFAFRLEGDKMWQKETSFDTVSGRETLADSSSFNILFEKVDCRNTDYRMIKH